MSDVTFQWDRPFVSGQPIEKPLDLSKQNLAQVMTILTPGEGTKFIAIG
jgi:hypothetical protein